jgi:hypothetical protein
MKRQPAIAGQRKRHFRVRSHKVPDAVHVIQEFMHDMCLELGICPQCRLRLLARKAKKTLNHCEVCLKYKRDYYRREAA